MVDLEMLTGPDGQYPVDIARMLSSADPEKKEILVAIGTMVIEHSQYHDAWDWLEDIFNEYGTGLEGTAGLLYGAPGVGKSTVLRNFVRKYGGPFPTEEGDKRPVIRVSTPANPTLVNTYKAMLRALGVSEALTSDTDDLRQIILEQLPGQDVRMIIFDEFTHIVEDRTERFATRAVRGLKELLSENQCQCVFAGTEQLVGVHSLYQQFRRRSAGDFVFYPFDWESSDDRNEWLNMLELLQSELPIKPLAPLSDDQTARKMHIASNGVLDHLMKLLFRATSFAYDDGETTISNENMSQAFERLRRGRRDLVNPFGAPRRPRKGIQITSDDPEDEGDDDQTPMYARKKRPPRFEK